MPVQPTADMFTPGKGYGGYKGGGGTSGYASMPGGSPKAYIPPAQPLPGKNNIVPFKLPSPPPPAAPQSPAEFFGFKPNLPPFNPPAVFSPKDLLSFLDPTPPPQLPSNLPPTAQAPYYPLDPPAPSQFVSSHAEIAFSRFTEQLPGEVQGRELGSFRTGIIADYGYDTIFVRGEGGAVTNIFGQSSVFTYGWYYTAASEGVLRLKPLMNDSGTPSGSLPSGASPTIAPDVVPNTPPPPLPNPIPDGIPKITPFPGKPATPVTPTPQPDKPPEPSPDPGPPPQPEPPEPELPPSDPDPTPDPTPDPAPPPQPEPTPTNPPPAPNSTPSPNSTPPPQESPPVEPDPITPTPAPIFLPPLFPAPLPTPSPGPIPAPTPTPTPTPPPSPSPDTPPNPQPTPPPSPSQPPNQPQPGTPGQPQPGTPGQPGQPQPGTPDQPAKPDTPTSPQPPVIPAPNKIPNPPGPEYNPDPGDIQEWTPYNDPKAIPGASPIPFGIGGNFPPGATPVTPVAAPLPIPSAPGYTPVSTSPLPVPPAAPAPVVPLTPTSGPVPAIPPATVPIVPTVVPSIPPGARPVGPSMPTPAPIVPVTPPGPIDPCKSGNIDPCTGQISDTIKLNAALTAGNAAAIAALAAGLVPVPTPVKIFVKCENNAPVYGTQVVGIPANQIGYVGALFEKIANTEGKHCNESSAIATVPEWWQLRPEANRPQGILVFKEIRPDGTIGNDPYAITIPHCTLAVAPDSSPLLSYKKGSIQGILTLKDNSKLIVNCKDIEECERVIAALSAVITSDQLEGSNTKIGKTNGIAFKQIEVKAQWLHYYPNGAETMKPAYIKSFF